MGMIQEFDYFKCKSVEDVIDHMTLFKNSKILAGGTDLIANLKEDRVKTEVLLDIKGIKKLQAIKLKGKVLEIGSLVTFSDLLESKLIKEKFPIFTEMAKTVASKAIRNRGTVVGNICSAVPCMDSAPVLLAFDAVVIIEGVSGKREIPISKWFKNCKLTVLKKDELVTSIRIPVPKIHSGSFLKLRRYKGEDLAQANICIIITDRGEYRVSFGSVGPTPIRAKEIEKILSRQEFDLENLKEFDQLIEETISPITDIRATKEYRTHMCKVMFKRALKASTQRFKGQGPKYGEFDL